MEQVIDMDGNLARAQRIEIDIERLRRIFTKICLGIYYHELGSRLEGNPELVIGFLQSRNQNIVTERNMRIDHAEFLLRNSDLKGDNPDIFRYKFMSFNNDELHLLFMTFYGGLDVITWLSLHDQEPKSIPMLQDEESFFLHRKQRRSNEMQLERQALRI